MNLPCLQCFGSGPRVDQDSTGLWIQIRIQKSRKELGVQEKKEKIEKYIQELDVLL